jgi:hypothetical protein
MISTSSSNNNNNNNNNRSSNSMQCNSLFLCIYIIIIIIIIIILKQETESRCRLCKEYEETTDHLTSECPSLANNEYIIHHKVCIHLHYSICKRLRTETTENWYSHTPKSVTEQKVITVLWNQRGTRGSDA